MKDNTDRMDKAIKEKLNGHEAHVPSTLWKSIESKLPPEPDHKGGLFFKNPFIISFLVISMVITGVYLFRSVNIKEQTATASVAIPSASSHTFSAENADKHSNENTHTSSTGLNRNTNDSKHTMSAEENMHGTQQKLPSTGNNHSGSKTSSINNSTSTNMYAASTTNMHASSGNNKHISQTNNTGVATQNHTANQYTTSGNHTGSVAADTKNNSNYMSQGAATNKLNTSASGTIGTTTVSKKVNEATTTSAQHNNTVNKTSEYISADAETSQENNQSIAATAASSENTSRTDATTIAQASPKLFSGADADTTSSTDNTIPNNNHSGITIDNISSAQENSNQPEDVPIKNTNESNTIQTAQTKNSQQDSADGLSDMRAYFGDSIQVPNSEAAIAASSVNTLNNKPDSIDTDKKIIDSSSVQKNPEALTTASQENKKHTSVFLSKCSFDGYITPSFGYMYTAANNSIINSEDSLNKFIQNRNQNTKTGSGITAGLRMNYALSKKIEVGVGLQYSSLSQSSYLTQKILDSTHYTYQGYTMNDSIYDSIQGIYLHRQYFVKTDSSTINSYHTQTKKHIDKYQNFSIPIYIAYGYSVTDRLSLLARTCLLINYQLYSITYLNETEDKIVGHHSRKNISLGGSFSIGGYYAFSRSCSVFVEPAVTYYFSNLFDKQAPIKQTLLMFGLQTGIRLSF